MTEGIRRRHIVWLCALLLVCPRATAPLFAETVGSPASVLEKGEWAMGLAAGTVFDRELEGEAKVVVYHAEHFRGYGLTDWLSVYGKLGGAYLEVDDSSIIKPNDSSTTNRFGGNVVSGFGLKARLWPLQRSSWEWDADIHYLDMRARHKGKNEGRWHEWQFATSVAKSLGPLKPYVGLKYSVVNFLYRVRKNAELVKQGRYRESRPLGYVLGTDWYFGQKDEVVLNVESAYQNGAELTVSVTYVF